MYIYIYIYIYYVFYYIYVVLLRHALQERPPLGSREPQVSLPRLPRAENIRGLSSCLPTTIITIIIIIIVSSRG